ncbi:hypothetical protein [Stenotrophomonas lactitubi]|uniref:hypothetical protein n=1 Tax=Stenotrophomonas lactitubi TaxID=2045214 RepID=UPI0033425E18
MDSVLISTAAHSQLGDQLRAALLNNSIRAMSVSGPWGTGKTHCVRSTLKANRREAAFASLFSVKSISNLKLTLLDNIVAEQGGIRGWLARRTKADRDVYGAAIEKLYSGAAIANDLALIAFRSAVRGKVIVLDDLERKHPDLDIDEVAGFIDELMELSACRVILIMNSERLTDHSKWMKIREKIIDRELFYSPTPQESTAIALSGHLLAEVITPLITGCGITNIRAIRRIALEIDWLGEKKYPEGKPLREFLASFVLMMGANLHALGQQGVMAKIDPDRTGSIKRHDQFRSACSTLLIDPDNEFIESIDLFLRTGIMPSEHIASMLDRRLKTERVSDLQFESIAVRNDYFWDIDWSDDKALEYCLELCVESASCGDPHLLSHILQTLELIGGQEALQSASSALSTFRSTLERQPREFTPQNYHPAVLGILKSLQPPTPAGAATPPEVKDDRMHGLAAGGFAYASVLNLSTTHASFLEQLGSMDAADMRYVVPAMLNRCGNIISSREHPDLEAAQAFQGACTQYVRENPQSKRARLINAAMRGDYPAGQSESARNVD